MFGENAAFLKSVEIDDSIFQCDPQCDKKYLLQLEWSADNEARQWRVLDAEDVLTSNDASDHSAVWELTTEVWTLTNTVNNLVTTGEDAPSTAPSKAGLLYVDTEHLKLYVSTWTSSAVYWVVVN